MSKTINLQEILDDTCTFKNHHGKLILTEEEVLLAMKEACKQTLELAAENSEVKYDYGYTVAEQSILETINQIK